MVALMSIMFPAAPTNPPFIPAVKETVLDGAAVGPATVGAGVETGEVGVGGLDETTAWR